ncbi:MAG: TetR/AcrR family transcriptional regulator [Eubacteriales bacterium]
MQSVDLGQNCVTKPVRKETDRRNRKTKALFKSTLMELLMEMDLKDITVSLLTDRADVNRGTFYLHYKDIYDLFDQVETELLEDFTNVIAKHKEQQEVFALPAMVDTFQFIATNAEFFIAILRTKETSFFAKLIEMNKPQNKDEWRKLVGNTKEGYYEYCYTFITSGAYAMLSRWFSEGMPESPERMAELAVGMMKNCVQGLI